MREFSRHQDSELISLIQGNDRDAFTEFYNRHWEGLFTIALKVTKDDDESSDIVQDIFINLWLKRLDLGEIQSINSYLFHAVRNKSLMYIRKNIVRNDYLKSLSLHFSEVRDSLGEQQAANELAVIIDKEVESLPAKMREVYLLSRKEHLSHKQIADQLNISEKTVKKQIGNALKHFKGKLDDHSIISISILSILLFKNS